MPKRFFLKFDMNPAKFLKNKNNRLPILFSIMLLETLLLYIKGIILEREIGRRANYPIAFAEILTVALYALFFRMLMPKLKIKFPKAGEFFSQKASVKYLIAFMLLIIAAVIFSLTGFVFFVLQISNIAYFMLVTAVALEVAAAVKEK